MSARPQVYFNVHLVSDSTGETLNAVARAVAAQFEQIHPLEHSYYLVRSERQLERVLTEVAGAPGIVLFTLSNAHLREMLQKRCRELDMPSLAVLDVTVDLFARYLGVTSNSRVAAQHSLDQSYFNRIEAVNFVLAHDDGQALHELHLADVVLTGVSRTSKTPTCVYLANRGVRAANVPLVPTSPPPRELLELKNTLVVGLRISPDRLLQIRRNRLLGIGEDAVTDYADEDAVREEIRESLRLFDRMGWPTIDVSRRSVEETAAAILNMIAERKR